MEGNCSLRAASQHHHQNRVSLSFAASLWGTVSEAERYSDTNEYSNSHLGGKCRNGEIINSQPKGRDFGSVIVVQLIGKIVFYVTLSRDIRDVHECECECEQAICCWYWKAGYVPPSHPHTIPLSKYSA